MKKLITIGLAAALTFAVAHQASATALETSGEYRARLWQLGNYVASDKSTEMWDMRLRLNMVWPVAEGVKVIARADIMEGLWGDNVEVATTTGTPPVTTYAPAPNTRKPIDFDWLNLQFAWPGSPVTIQVGRQNANWGTGLFVAVDNRDRFKITAKFADTTLLYTYDKYTEVFGLHDTASLDDRTQHSIGVVSKIGDLNVGLIGAYIMDGTNPDLDVTLYGPDVYVMGKMGPVDVKAEFAYVTGKNDYKSKPDVDLQGTLAYLGISVPAGPVTLGFEGIYAAGDKPGSATKNEGALKEDYQGPFWSVILFNNMDYQGYDNLNNYAGDTSVANAIAGKFSVAAMPMKGLSFYGAAVYATRDQKVGTNNEKGLGTELDLVGNYAITDNVSWTIGGGYLMAGNYYGDVKNPWGAVSAFTVKF